MSDRQPDSEQDHDKRNDDLAELIRTIVSERRLQRELQSNPEASAGAERDENEGK